MFKKLLMAGALLLVLMAGFAMVPAKQAHADSCRSGTCSNLDPVQMGCSNSQAIIADSLTANESLKYGYYGNNYGQGTPATPVQIGSHTWAVQLYQSTYSYSQNPTCYHQIWAVFRQVDGHGACFHDTVSGEQYLEVFGTADDVFQSDWLCDGAWSNMVTLDTSVGGSVARYVGPQWPAGSGNNVVLNAGFREASGR